MKRNLIIAFVFIALAALFYGYRTYNKEHKNLNELRPDYIVKPETFLTEFETDENAAVAKYLNKIIETKSQLIEIQTIGNQVIWILSTGNPLSNIQCEMDSRYVNKLNEQVKTGQEVTVQGICTGKLMDIVLNQAIYKN